MFLPVTPDELGGRQPDFIYVTGDAYVDHPSFGSAIIGRMLEAQGFTVAMLPQPDFRSDRDIKKFGAPKLAFLVSGGNIDSMVAHYTVAGRLRSDDMYSPGGRAGKRPDRAVEVYCSLIKKAFPETPVIIGGLEASLRRFAHYDYWSDSVRPSILLSSGADMLSYGMGENSISEIAKRLKAGEKISDMRDIKGTCYLCPVTETPYDGAECPSYKNVCENKREYAIAARIQQDEQDAFRGKRLKQRHGSLMLVQNPPAIPLTTEQLDKIYSLPYERNFHPMYEKDGGVPGLKEVKFSITHVRGCFGACAFCSIAFHQGRYISVRSHKSVLDEAKLLTKLPDFKGYIHDVGGPTANFRRPSCDGQEERGLCKGKRCLAPSPCKNLICDHSDYLELLRELEKIPGIKKVFIRSGLRFDYILQDKSDEFFNELVSRHISGQLKLAPEHCSAAVLDKMGKPHIEAYKKFADKYFAATKKAGKEQYIVPYLMSSHPGSTLKDAVELALFIKQQGLRPQQVQDFYPTPGTISTAMFYTGLDPYTLQEVYIPKSKEEKAMQRALMRYFDPSNRDTVIKALKIAGRQDLIGQEKSCLVNAPANYKNDKGRNRNERTAYKYKQKKK